jgi:hypothetical protein
MLLSVQAMLRSCAWGLCVTGKEEGVAGTLEDGGGRERGGGGCAGGPCGVCGVTSAG